MKNLFYKNENICLKAIFKPPGFFRYNVEYLNVETFPTGPSDESYR